jgi:hypothetical protein
MTASDPAVQGAERNTAGRTVGDDQTVEGVTRHWSSCTQPMKIW